jgi:Phosphoinositide phospholipase C, Ca2+-dependent
LFKILVIIKTESMIRLIVSLLLAVAVVPQRNDDLDELPLNKIQLIGSHNSYKQAIDPALFKFLSNADSAGASKIVYNHIPITEQLNLGLCNLEIDIYADEKGGKYAHPKGLDWVPNQRPYDTEGVMKQPGFKILHIQDIDFRSNYLTLQQCLAALKQWSDSHKDHYPVFITMNAKDEVINRPGFTIPDKFTPAVLDRLDQTILENLGRENLIIPDDIRGTHSSLEQAVLAGNWPVLKKAKGKFIFILDETGDKRAAYIAGHPSLKGRTLFANAEPGTPEAAILILNNAKKDGIAGFVTKGYIVRTRADADTHEARINDRSVFEAACISGAQIITTDYYRKSDQFNSDYIISFERGTYIRKNPLLVK